MFTRRNLLLALVGALLVSGGYAAGRHHRRTEATRTVATALARLEARGMSFHVYPAAAHGNLAREAYLCDGPRRAEDFAVMPRMPRYAGRWRGNVLVQIDNPDAPVTDEHLEAWGLMGARVGRLILFGDPEMVAQIVQALR